MDIQELHNLFLQSTMVSTDSRNCPSGSMFFALKGDNFNGNAFAKQVLESGAKYAVIDEAEYYLDERTILVDNVLSTLQKLANYHRLQFNIPVIGITGTNGKTTTKELISTLLSTEKRVLFTQGNFNNHIGVPLTLLRIENTHEIAIIEMGANHCGEIAALCEIAMPNFGIITNIGKAHLEGFGSYENVIKTKSELYNFIEKNGGSLFFNDKDLLLNDLSKNIARIEYRDTKNGILETISEAPFLSFAWKIENTNIEISTKLTGIYNQTNILAAIAVAKHFTISNKSIAEGLSNYTPTNNRSQVLETAKNRLYLDAYNANPSSMKVSLESFNSLAMDKKIVILGDMLELGDYSFEEHRTIVTQLSQYNIEQVFLVGNEFCKANNISSFKQFSSCNDLITYINQQNIAGYNILLKGSRGIKLEQLIPFL